MESRPAQLRSRKVCRFCLADNESLSYIYDREINRPYQVPLALQIMSCVSIEVYAADGMPQMICQNCRWNLDRCYKFKQQCKKADEALRNYPVTGVLPRPFPPITTESSELNNKRNLEQRPIEQQAKKARLDNGERDRREIPHSGNLQRQIETRQEKQQREDERHMYDEDQELGSEGENEVNDLKADTKLEPGEIRVHACTQCERTFPLHQSLQLHIQRAHRDRDYKCTECDRMFFSKYDLSKHMTTHSEEKPYSCQICQKQFARANLLQRHEKVHREELRYGCPSCEREFFTPEELEKHEETVHKTVKPFQCNICSKRFTYKQGLERHEMLHNEDKSFSCEYCKEAFRTSNKLARHLQTHAGHRPFLCKLCPKSFLLSHHLTRHMRTHSVEKNHACEDCGKAFKRKESLEVHQLTHVKRAGMGLTCNVCNESCRNRADYVTHIKQHIEAGEKMGPDGLPPDNKVLLGELESDEEEEEEEEEPYSDGDDDYQPPYHISKNIPRGQKLKNESEDDHTDEKKEQIVYVRGKDGNMVKKTIKTLMPIQRRSESQVSPVKAGSSTQIVTTKQMKEGVHSQVPKGRVDETEAQVQKIVANILEKHPVKNSEQTKESQIARQTTQTIIKEEKIDPSIPGQKSANTVKVIKRIVVRKPAGSVDSTAITGPVRELVQEAAAAAAQPSPSTSAGPKVTKRVIVRRIIRQGDVTREVIMNPDGTIIDPAELAKLPTGNVVKRVVVKKPLDKCQNIEAMLQSPDTKRLLNIGEGEEIIKASSLIPMAKTASQTVQRVAQTTRTVTADGTNDRDQKIAQLTEQVAKQQLKIEELQARKQEYEACDDMLPERHDESDDEQQLPLKRVFVKRKQSIYDEVREYNDQKEKEDDEAEDSVETSGANTKDPKEEELSQTSTAYEEKNDQPESPSRSIENAKIIIIKPEDSQQDVDEMSTELCNILDSTDAVVKMQENVLNNLTEITSINEPSHKNYEETVETSGQEEERLEAPTSTVVEESMEQEEIVSGDLEQVEEVTGQEDPSVKVVISQSDDSNVKLEYESQPEENNQVEVTEENIERTESGISTQALSESHEIFDSSDATMEVEIVKSQEEADLGESGIELATSNEPDNLNETSDTRDSLEDKLSQMEG